jgi:hypothetical protein
VSDIRLAADSGQTYPGITSTQPEGDIMATTDADFPGRHPSTAGIMRYFAHGHLPSELAAVSGECQSLAHTMVALLPDGPELTAGLRKLLEAKDCFVRANLDRPEGH